MAVTRITGSGQVTIPAEIRKKHNMHTGDQVMWSENATGEIVVRPVTRTVDELFGIFPLLPGVETDGDFDDLIEEAFEEGYAEQFAEFRREETTA